MYTPIPKGWPQRATYAQEPVAPEMNLAILRDFLTAENPNDLHKTSPLIASASVHPHLHIKKIEDPLHPLSRQKTLKGHANYGVFASANIPSRTEIGEYVGEIYLYFASPEQSVQTVFAKLPFSEYRWMFKAQNVFVAIDGQNVANEMSLVNDYRGIALEPNVHMQTILHKGRCYFGYVTVREIQKGEELLTDYGEMFWEIFQASIPPER